MIEIFKFSVFKGVLGNRDLHFQLSRVQTDATLLHYMLRPFAHPIACFTLLRGCWELSRKV